MTLPDLESVLDFAGRWPILLSIVVSGAAGWIVSLMVERYFLPTVQDPNALRHQKGLTYLLNWGLATAFTTIMWDALVDDVPLVTRLEVSIVAGVVTAFAYPILARVATAKWPAIGSAWKAPEA